MSLGAAIRLTATSSRARLCTRLQLPVSPCAWRTLPTRTLARPISTSAIHRSSSNDSSAPSTINTALPEALEPRLSMTFTCTVTGCNERSSHTFTKRAYERGIVIVQCPGCKNRHLIADHLGWFKESTEDGKLCTIEDLLRARGEKVRRGRIDAGGVVEYTDD